MIERLLFRVLPVLVRVLFLPRVDLGRQKNDVYNTRYTVIPTWVARFFGKHAVFLHHFQSDDPTFDFHNHPYERSTAYVLAGGYWEERAFFARAIGQDVRPSLSTFLKALWLEYTPGMRNTIFAHTFHRVELRDKARGCWTLFVAGAKRPGRVWGFWNRNTGVFTPWSGKPASEIYVDRPEAL